MAKATAPTVRHIGEYPATAVTNEVLALARGEHPDTWVKNEKQRRRARSGRMYEEWFQGIHAIYRRRGEAVIARCPNEVMTRRMNRRGDLYRVRRIPGEVDFIGRWLDRPIAFDLKGSNEATFAIPPSDRSGRRQLDFLLDFTRDPEARAIGFFLILNAVEKRCYLVQPEQVKGGRVVRLRVRHEPQVPAITESTDPRAPMYDYLSLVRRVYEERHTMTMTLPPTDSPYREE